MIRAEGSEARLSWLNLICFIITRLRLFPQNFVIILAFCHTQNWFITHVGFAKVGNVAIRCVIAYPKVGDLYSANMFGQVVKPCRVCLLWNGQCIAYLGNKSYMGLIKLPNPTWVISDIPDSAENLKRILLKYCWMTKLTLFPFLLKIFLRVKIYSLLYY